MYFFIIFYTTWVLFYGWNNKHLGSFWLGRSRDGRASLIFIFFPYIVGQTNVFFFLWESNKRLFFPYIVLPAISATEDTIRRGRRYKIQDRIFFPYGAEMDEPAIKAEPYVFLGGMVVEAVASFAPGPKSAYQSIILKFYFLKKFILII